MNPDEFLQGGKATVVTPDRLSFGEFSGGAAVKAIQPKTPEERLNFAQRFGKDLEKRVGIANEISDAVTSGEQSFAEGILQMAGKVGVGGTFDLIGQGLVSTFRAIPDAIEEPIRNASSAFLETPVAQSGLDALQGGIQRYQEWKGGNQRAARNLESVVNVGLLLAPVRRTAPSQQTGAGKAAGALETKATAQTVSTRQSFIDDLVRPAQVKKVRESQVGRTTEKGLFRRKEIAPSKAEVAIAKEVSKIDGVSRSKTLQGNYNLINQANKDLARRLETDIATHDFAYPKRELVSALNKTKARLKENPLMVGDAEKTAEKLLNKFRQLVEAGPGTGSGLLKARKGFDQWVKRQKGNVFDAKNENALTTSLREIRETANDFLEKGAKDVGVKASLKQQSTLYRALDNITPKAANEASNAAIRAWQNVTRILPLRGEFNQSLAVLFGLGGLGASAVFAPFFTKMVMASLFTYGAGKVVMSAGMKKAIAQLLKGIDRAIRTTKDANMINQLRADRALLLEVLDAADEAAEETEE